jgi:glycosyltransferase involved in cell wall biosynthesis
MHVLAPHAEGAATEEQMGPLQVHRFRYGPASMESLAYGGGILENVKKKPLRWALVPPFLASQIYSTWRLAKKYRFNLLHVHWVIPQGLSSAVLPASITIPKLLTAHGGDVFASTSGVRKAIVRFVVERHDAITVNSTAMAEAVEDLTGRDSTVIPMGVDLQRFSSAPNRKPFDSASSTQILFVGRLAEKKGVEYLIRAMPQIRSAIPGARLKVVGDGPRREMLEREAVSAGVSESVTFEGARPNSELPDYYNNADLFVAPSVIAESGDTEALGVVLLEAAGCGLPIISTRIGGIGDVVRDGETGLVVQQKSSEELAVAAISLLGDRGKAIRLGDAARRHVMSKFSWDNVASRFAGMYERLTENHEAVHSQSIEQKKPA